MSKTEMSNDEQKQQQRKRGEFDANDALAILGASLNHVYAAGLVIAATNDDASADGGALVIRITGAMAVQDGGVTKFVAR